MSRDELVAAIRADRDSFTLLGVRPDLPPIALGDIEEIVFFKRDELTTDLMCCEITVSADKGEETWFLHEEIPGFDDLVMHLERLPTFDRNWRDAVVQPPFADNRTVAFRKPR